MDTLEREQNKQKESNKSESIQYNMQLTGSDPRPNQYTTVLRNKSSNAVAHTRYSKLTKLLLPSTGAPTLSEKRKVFLYTQCKLRVMPAKISPPPWPLRPPAFPPWSRMLRPFSW